MGGLEGGGEGKGKGSGKGEVDKEEILTIEGISLDFFGWREGS